MIVSPELTLEASREHAAYLEAERTPYLDLATRRLAITYLACKIWLDQLISDEDAHIYLERLVAAHVNHMPSPLRPLWSLAEEIALDGTTIGLDLILPAVIR